MWARMHLHALQFLVYFYLGWGWHERPNTSMSMQSSHSFWWGPCHCSKSDRFRQSVCRIHQTWRNRKLRGSCNDLLYVWCLSPGDNLGKKGWYAGRKKGKFHSLFLFPFDCFYQMEVVMVLILDKGDLKGKANQICDFEKYRIVILRVRGGF